MKKEDLEKRIRAEALGERIKLLFGFVLQLKEDKDLLEEAADASNTSANFAMSAAPLLGAMGMDYEEENFEATLRLKRTRAILNLINTLEETEKEREEFKKKKQAKEKGRETLRRILG